MLTKVTQFAKELLSHLSAAANQLLRLRWLVRSSDGVGAGLPGHYVAVGVAARQIAAELSADVLCSQDNPDKVGYSWWNMVTRSRERNIGWRLDYFFVSPELRDHIVEASIHADVLGSDHCPVSLVLDV